MSNGVQSQRIRPIEVLEWDDIAELPRFRRDNRAVIIRGMPSCDAMEWNIDALDRACGHVDVLVVACQSPNIGFTDKTEREVARMRFSEFIAHTFRGATIGNHAYYYLGRSPLAQFQAIAGDVWFPPELRRHFRGPLAFEETNLWIGGQNMSGALHFDTVENFNLQVRGRKRFRLFEAAIAPFEPFPALSQAAYVSRFNPRLPDFRPEDHPSYMRQTAYESVLEAGDVVYIPYGWWHQVESLGEENINVNVWWLPGARKLARYWQQTVRGAAVLCHRRGKNPHRRIEALHRATARTSTNIKG